MSASTVEQRTNTFSSYWKNDNCQAFQADSQIYKLVTWTDRIHCQGRISSWRLGQLFGGGHGTLAVLSQTNCAQTAAWIGHNWRILTYIDVCYWRILYRSIGPWINMHQHESTWINDICWQLHFLKTVAAVAVNFPCRLRPLSKNTPKAIMGKLGRSSAQLEPLTVRTFLHFLTAIFTVPVLEL
jgi:hypothetical protein